MFAHENMAVYHKMEVPIFGDLPKPILGNLPKSVHILDFLKCIALFPLCIDTLVSYFLVSYLAEHAPSIREATRVPLW